MIGAAVVLFVAPRLWEQGANETCGARCHTEAQSSSPCVYNRRCQHGERVCIEWWRMGEPLGGRQHPDV